MAKQAAGILLFRRGAAGAEVLLAHPGGPLWARKDLGAWTLPKGQFNEGEQPLDAAKREFEEEMGSAPAGEFQPLGTLKQPSGKVIHTHGGCHPNVRSFTTAASRPHNMHTSGSAPAASRVERMTWAMKSLHSSPRP